jgi:hypothetical protein
MRLQLLSDVHVEFTHHLPTHQSVAVQYAGNPLNAFSALTGFSRAQAQPD